MKKIKAFIQVYKQLKQINQLIKKQENMKKLFGENLKDTVSNYCGIGFFLATIVLTISTAGVTLPLMVITGAKATIAVTVLIAMRLTGKNPDGSVKTPEQVSDANNGK